MKARLRFLMLLFFISYWFNVAVWAQHEHQPARPDTSKADQHKNGTANNIHAGMMDMSNVLIPEVRIKNARQHHARQMSPAQESRGFSTRLGGRFALADDRLAIFYDDAQSALNFVKA